jgi:predicted pyridoxine 5'-phosphate oxidase superfamily flavin-nucleotide-binding protein
MTSFYHHQQQHDVFHEGEKLVQRRAGQRRRIAHPSVILTPSLSLSPGTARSAAQLGASMIEALLPPDAPLMLAAAPYLALTSLHNRRPWTSLLFGPPGFVRATDLETIVVQVAADAADPFLHNARAAIRTDADVDVDVDPTAAFVGMLCIDFVTRDRLRINAQVVAVEEPQGATVNVVLQVREVFGNCPKYIQARELPLPPPRVLSTHVVDQGSSGGGSGQTAPASLNNDQIALVRKADTFFLGTLHPNRGADCSHRGGRPGFVRVEDATHVWWPDYSGNGMVGLVVLDLCIF